MPADRETFMHRWFEEVWNKGRSSAIDEMMAEDAQVHGLGEAGIDVRGPAAFKPFAERLRSAYWDTMSLMEQIGALSPQVTLLAPSP